MGSAPGVPAGPELRAMPRQLKRQSSVRRVASALIVGVPAAMLAATFLYFLRITDRYIEAERPVTLIYEPHSFYGHVLKPNQNFRDASGSHFSIGPHGMRGEEPAMPKDPSIVRIYAVGGSSVFDHLAMPSWPERLGPLLSTAGKRVESFNGGVPGYSSRETLSFYRDRVARYQPDIVILYAGWNDVKYMKVFVDDANVETYFGWRREFETQYRFLTAPRPIRNWYAFWRMRQDTDPQLKAKESHLDEGKRRQLAGDDRVSRDWSATAGMRFFRKNVEDLIDRVQRDGGRPILLVENTLASKEMPLEDRFKRIKYEWVGVGHGDLLAINDAIAALLEDVAQKEGVPVIDLRSLINGRPEYFSDHVHLTPAGSAALARALADAMHPLL